MVHGVMHMYVMSLPALHVCLTYFDFALITHYFHSINTLQEDPLAVNKAILDFANEVHG